MKQNVKYENLKIDVENAINKAVLTLGVFSLPDSACSVGGKCIAVTIFFCHKGMLQKLKKNPTFQKVPSDIKCSDSIQWSNCRTST